MRLFIRLFIEFIGRLDLLELVLVFLLLAYFCMTCLCSFAYWLVIGCVIYI